MKNTMKRFLALLVCGLIILSFSACGGNEEETNVVTESEPAVEESSEVETTDTEAPADDEEVDDAVKGVGKIFDWNE